MRNRNLDFIKIIAAIFVVTIHVQFPGAVGALVKSFAEFAVPVFFMVSGYFSYNAIENKEYSKLSARIKKLISIYIPSTLVYFIVDYLIRTPSQRKQFISEGLSIQSFIKLILLNKPLFNVTLWFLLALIYCYLIVMFFVKIGKMKFLSVCSIILVFINIIVTDFILGLFYYKISQNIPESALLVRNFLLSGITMFMVGYLIKKYSEKVNTLSNKTLFITLAASVVIFAAEFLLFEQKTALSNKITAIALFILATNNERNIKYSTKDKILSEMPLVMYIVHFPLIGIISHFAKQYNIFGNPVFSWAHPIIIVLLSLAVSYFVSMLIVKYHSRKTKITQ